MGSLPFTSSDKYVHVYHFNFMVKGVLRVYLLISNNKNKELLKVTCHI